MDSTHDRVQSAGAQALPLLAAALHSADPALALFQAVEQGLARAPGHRLMTVLVYFHDQGESQRAYSSRPDEYPIGGRKTLGQAPRMRQVLASGEPFLGHTRRDIVENFPDHEKLLAMGCESIVNMPVRWGAQVLGTVNLLHAERHYAQHDLPLIEAWAHLSLPAFLAAVLRR